MGARHAKPHPGDRRPAAAQQGPGPTEAQDASPTSFSATNHQLPSVQVPASVQCAVQCLSSKCSVSVPAPPRRGALAPPGVSPGSSTIDNVVTEYLCSRGVRIALRSVGLPSASQPACWRGYAQAVHAGCLLPLPYQRRSSTRDALAPRPPPTASPSKAAKEGSTPPG